MNLVFSAVILATVLQVAFCGFHLPLLLSIIGRIVFLTRLLGAVVPIKISLVFEGAHLFFLILPIIMNGGSNDWIGVLLNVIFCAVAALLFIVDNTFYSYVVEDDEEEDT